MKKFLFLLLIFCLLGAAAFGWWRSTQTATAVSASLTSTLPETDISGFTRATVPDALELPQDLGAHEAFQTEWWYYTGNLQAADGREFGYQLTFFRRALAPPEAAEPASSWRTNQIYFAHFTISDIANNTFYQSERFSRGSTGLAGARAVPYAVWLENWSVREGEPGVVTLTAQAPAASLQLNLSQSRPPILHGEGGLSRKGPETGNASYYYSLVQQPTTGQVQIGEETLPVTGISWKDHEYSSGALPAGTIGWDWFSVQLDDGTAVMFGQIRQERASGPPVYTGTFVEADGTYWTISPDNFHIEVTDTWRSPHSDGLYPAAWDIHMPTADLTLTAVPLMADQELTTTTTYWEGAVSYEGSRRGQPVTGKGYIELTGYSGPMPIVP